MKKQTWLKGAALVAIAALALSGCSKKAEAQEGGSGGGSSRSSVRESPASDFSYDLTADGQGILIKNYTGAGGDVVIPSRIEDMPVLEIGRLALAKRAITSIIIPNTVRKIGYNAFAGTAITRLDMPDSVTSIGAGDTSGKIFEGCSQLTEIRFSDNIEYIPNILGAGYNSQNRSLTKINLPKNLKMIGINAFNYASELTEIVIPDTLASVEFVNVTGLSSSGEPSKWLKEGDYDMAYVNSRYPVINAFQGCSKLPLATRQRLKDLGYNGSF